MHEQAAGVAILPSITENWHRITSQIKNYPCRLLEKYQDKIPADHIRNIDWKIREEHKIYANCQIKQWKK